MRDDNIMFIIPTLVGGGAEKTVANLSQYLKKYYNVFIVVIDDTDQKYKFGGKLIVLNKRKETNALMKIVNIFSRTKELKRIKKENNIKCSISFLFQADLINILSKGEEKCVISVRNKDSKLFEGTIYKKVAGCCFRKSDRIVAISKFVKKDLVDNFGVKKEKIYTIYNPCLLSEFGAKKRKINKELFEHGLVFVNMARLNIQKGQWHLIRAFSKVVKEFPDAKLLILGTGELEGYLSSLIDELGLVNNVFILGFVDNPYDYLRASDVFVFSSLFEGLGNSLIEAMGCGLPVISADCDCGPREILAPDTAYDHRMKRGIEDGRYGIIVPVPDGVMYDGRIKLTKEEGALADAMLSLAKDRQKMKKYGELSRRRVKDFDIEHIIKKWRDVIND